MTIQKKFSLSNRLKNKNKFFHPKFGDLLDPMAVKMGKGETGYIDEWIEEQDDTRIHLTVTGRCNASCQGCINSSITLNEDRPRNTLITSQETQPERDAIIIEKLCAKIKTGKITVCLYGGEPLLSAGAILELMKLLDESSLKNKIRYMLYTNGEFIDKTLKELPELVERIWLFSVSIDGDQEQHNRVRRGTDLNHIIANLRLLKKQKNNGMVLFWSTLRESQSLLKCFSQFKALYEEGLVDHFFYHWAEAKEPFTHFHDYLGKYEKDLEYLLDVYEELLEKKNSCPYHI